MDYKKEGVERLYETAILHTALGDITIKLFGKECPRAVENFCVHSKNGYYNSHIFHRVIKGFMVQTGDPTDKNLGNHVKNTISRKLEGGFSMVTGWTEERLCDLHFVQKK
uniref:Peptidyl-prolyl cis-trans isomerase n=1 Tax=Timema genevievae TaxID=629358 RepID=A0A7R9PJT2_TIMGE|nr:unnamed protein product [Timema genevievae]